MQRQPSCCLQGWPAAGAPARLGVVPVAYAAQEVHSRRCCGTIAFELPIRRLHLREGPAFFSRTCMRKHVQ
jgi:hypothetical protein